jgi:hypothetical protein
MRKVVLISTALGALALACAPAVQAATVLTFTSSFLTDKNQPFSGNAVFTYTGLGTMTLKLTDTTVNPVSDGPNLADLSFVIAGLTAGSVTGAQGSTVTGIQLGVVPTIGSYSGASPWQLTNATSGWWTQVYTGNAATFDLSAKDTTTGGPAGTCGSAAQYSIVGSPGANGTYTNPNNLKQTDIGSANFIASGCDDPMFYKSATFNLSITGLNATNFNTITKVAFGLGPDAPNKPDKDDVGGGVFTPTVVPEPASWAMMLIGFGGIGAMMRRSRRRRAVATA